MRLVRVAAIPLLLVTCDVAVAQVSAMVAPTPTIGATSPLGSAGLPVSPTGIPLGSTEIISAGVSPLPPGPAGTIATPGAGAPCSTLGTSSYQMYGSSATYDGGGMSVANSMPATGGTAGGTAASPGMSTGTSATSGFLTTSGMTQSSAMSASGTIDTAGMSGTCGSGSNSLAASSNPTSPTTPGGAPRAGIPLGSVEIGNLGVSSAALVPTMPVILPPSSVASPPTMPVAAPPASPSSSVP